jgi:hypothetical protein
MAQCRLALDSDESWMVCLVRLRSSFARQSGLHEIAQNAKSTAGKLSPISDGLSLLRLAVSPRPSSPKLL